MRKNIFILVFTHRTLVCNMHTPSTRLPAHTHTPHTHTHAHTLLLLLLLLFVLLTGASTNYYNFSVYSEQVGITMQLIYRLHRHLRVQKSAWLQSVKKQGMDVHSWNAQNVTKLLFFKNNNNINRKTPLIY